MNTYTFLLVLYMQQYLVPALKDRLKYYRNYDGSMKTKTEEETTQQEELKRK